MPDAGTPRPDAPLPRGVPGVWQLAWEGSVVRRALLFAAVVGPILIAINHGDALVAGEVDGERWLKMSLTLLVPYLVSTISSVAATRRSSGPACGADRG